MGAQNQMKTGSSHLSETRMRRWYLVPFYDRPANVDAATCVVDQGQDKCHDSTQNTPQELVRERGDALPYPGHAGRISTHPRNHPPLQNRRSGHSGI